MDEVAIKCALDGAGVTQREALRGDGVDETDGGRAVGSDLEDDVNIFAA